VVFSFFKKDPKSPTGGTHARGAVTRARPVPPRPTPRPPAANTNRPAAPGNGPNGPSTRFATTENAIAHRDLHKSLAMETAAKIDAIESEMARDFLRPGSTAANSAFPASAGRSTGQPVVKPAPAASDLEGEPTDVLGDVDLGSIDAIEISTSGAGSVIDETAILFANGQAAEAEEGLRAALAADNVGPNVHTAWHLLFELVNQSGDRAAFEQLTMDYVLRFENSPPAWMDYDGKAPAFSRNADGSAEAGAPAVRLPAAIDAAIVKPLETLKTYAATHAALTLDVSATRSVDLVGAELLLRVVNAFKRASHELTLVGLDALADALRAEVEAGRRDASDAAWMLLLEVLRLQGKQNDFEETGIQYCVTFEVSPPSWEPAPPNMKTKAARGADPAVADPGSDNPLEWRGLIDGEGEPQFGRLALIARGQQGNLVVECRHLRRMAFSAASALLNLVLRLQPSGVTLEFRNVNALVGALLHLLGVTAVAAVRLRRG
jgi:anti-anti-sigma regulatory factor